MALTPISGEIQAQPLNDNFSSIDAQLAETAIHVTNYATPQDAVAALPVEGGTVYFPRNSTMTYTIATAITTNVANTKFRCYRGVKIITSDDNGDAFLLAHENCDVQGFRIQGTGNPATTSNNGCGVKLLGVDSCSVKKNKISNVGGHGVFLGFSGTTGCTNCVVEKNKITGQVGTIANIAGILIGYSGTGYSHDNNIIQSNYVDGGVVAKYGVAIIAHGKGNKILFNKVVNTTDYGITAYESQYEDYTLLETTIIGNTVENIGVTIGTTDKGMGIYLQKSHDSIVSKNIIKNVLMGTDNTETLGRGAIALNSAIRCNVEGNQIRSSGQHGIVSLYSFETEISNNNVKTTAKMGILIKGSNDNILTKNILTDIGAYGIYGSFFITDTSGVVDYYNLETGKRISINDNIIKNNTSDAIALLGASTSLMERVSVSDNKITASGGFIYTSYIKDSIISENICKSTGSVGTIKVAQTVSDNVKILDNILLTDTNLTIGIGYDGINPDIRGNRIPLASTKISFQGVSFQAEPIILWSLAMPTLGTWKIGDTVYSLSVSILGSAGSKYILSGWKRVTTGSGNVLNTDWVEMRTLTGS